MLLDSMIVKFTTLINNHSNLLPVVLDLLVLYTVQVLYNSRSSYSCTTWLYCTFYNSLCGRTYYDEWASQGLPSARTWQFHCWTTGELQLTSERCCHILIVLFTNHPSLLLASRLTWCCVCAFPVQLNPRLLRSRSHQDRTVWWRSDPQLARGGPIRHGILVAILGQKQALGVCGPSARTRSELDLRADSFL